MLLIMIKVLYINNSESQTADFNLGRDPVVVAQLGERVAFHKKLLYLSCSHIDLQDFSFMSLDLTHL